MVKAISVPLREIVGTSREVNLKASVENFSCKDKDVEDFLKNKAFDLDKRHKSRTYLIIDSKQVNEDEPIIYGFFTVTLKSLELGETLSKNIVKRIDGFSKDVLATEAVLLGQLGKNQDYQSDIDGQLILHYALDTIYSVHKLAGGRIAFLECDENPKLINFLFSQWVYPLAKKR